MNDKNNSTQPLQKIYEVKLKDIEISDDNVRHSDPTRDLDELIASIKRHGLLQPVVLKGKAGTPPYELISGQRRFLAHEKLKAKTIRAVFAGDLDDVQTVVRSLVENLQRVELDFTDTSQAVTYLYKKYGHDEYKVQKETGLSIRKIREFILVEERASPHMKALLRKHKVKPADVKRALRAAQENVKKAEELLDLMMKHKPTAYQKRRIVTFGLQAHNASAKQIFNEALKSQVEQNIIISLPEELQKALANATKKLSMDPDELAAKVLADWLRNQGFAA